MKIIRRPLEQGKRRNEFQGAHGFRKFFKSRTERTMKSLNVEMLLGHDTGLAENYYRPAASEILEDYTRGVTDLTILEEVKAALTEDVQTLKQGYEELKKIVLDFIQTQELLNNSLEERFNRIEIERLKRSRLQHRQTTTVDHYCYSSSYSVPVAEQKQQTRISVS